MFNKYFMFYLYLNICGRNLFRNISASKDKFNSPFP